jgi:bifunctional non-homologous end joining protein LigD
VRGTTAQLARRPNPRLTRNGNDISAQFPELIEALQNVGHDLILDGELTIADERGRPDWSSVRRRCVMKGPKAIAADAAARPATLYTFDLLAIDGRDVRPATFAARRAALLQLVPTSPQIRIPDLWDDGAALFRAVTELELEGVVGKRLDSTYTAGRTKAWLKVRAPTARPQERG